MKVNVLVIDGEGKGEFSTLTVSVLPRENEMIIKNDSSGEGHIYLVDAVIHSAEGADAVAILSAKHMMSTKSFADEIGLPDTAL